MLTGRAAYVNLIRSGLCLVALGLAASPCVARDAQGRFVVKGSKTSGPNALYLARLRQVDGTWLFDSAGMVGMLR